MNKLIQKLDRAAGHWLNEMDTHLQAPVARTLSGDVFLYEAPSNENRVAEQPVLPLTPSAVAPVRKTGKSDFSSTQPTVLRKAQAVNKR